MTHTDYTKNILNIKDENIYFNENCLSEIKIKNKIVKCFHGVLTYTPNVCPICGCVYEQNPETIIKYGFKKNCKVKLPRLISPVTNFTSHQILLFIAPGL